MHRFAVLALLLVLLGGAGPARAADPEEPEKSWSETASEWWRRNVEIHGFAQTNLYGRFPNFEGGNDFRISSWRTELDLETTVHMLERGDWRAKFFGVLRPIYDSVYELNPSIWGDDANGGAFDPLTLGAATAPQAIKGKKFPGHGACVVGEFCLGNGDVGTLFSDRREPALIIDDVVFFGSVAAPWRPNQKVGGNATGDTYTEYLQSGAREEAALARLEAIYAQLPPPVAGLLPPPGDVVALGTAGLAQSLTKGGASLGLGAPLNFATGALGRHKHFGQAPFDVNRSEDKLKFDCLDNSHPWCFVREAYFQLDHEDTSVRLGRQQIVWGKTDAFRLQDVINPIDLGYHNIFPDLEDRRIPLLALDVIQGFGDVGPLQDVSLEFAWVFDRFRPDQFGQCGEPYAYTLACQGRSDAAGHNLLNLALASVQERDWSFTNTQPGLRLEFRIPEPSIAFSFSFFYGFQQLPVAQFVNRYSTENFNPAALLFLQGQGLGFFAETLCSLNPIAGCAPGNTVWTTGFDPYDQDGTATVANDILVRAWQNAFGGGCALLGLDEEQCATALQPASLPWSASEYVLKYPRIPILGGSLDYQIPEVDTVLRLEVAYDIDRRINDTAKADGVAKSDVFLGAIGLDRPTFIRFLNPTRTALLSFQTFFEHVVSYDDGRGSGDGMVVDENTIITTFLNEHYWRNDSLILRNLLAYDWMADALILAPSFKWVINQNLSAQIGLNFLKGAKTRRHNIRDLCPDTTLSCLGDPTTWNAGQWQTLNKGYVRTSQSPWFSRQSFADRFQGRRDEFWLGFTYQF